MSATVLVICAHPDDVDYGAAGAVATWTDAGDRVVYCIVTDGEAGGGDDGAGPGGTGAADSGPGLAAVRRAEQVRAAALVGVTDVRFLGFPDGVLTASFSLRTDLSRMIREVRPDRVVTHSPIRNVRRVKVSHPDHLAVGEALFCAVYDARTPPREPDLSSGRPRTSDALRGHTVSEIWVMAGREATMHVDITAAVDRKVAALQAHRSQGLATSATARMVHASAAVQAAAGGLPKGRLAEAFLVVRGHGSAENISNIEKHHDWRGKRP